MCAWPCAPSACRQDPVRPEQDIETADAAPGLAQIHRELAALPGETFEGISREGRPVRGIYRPGSRPAVLVTGGQHANETSAPVGTLRAVRRLLANPEANIAYIPVENPDGYALHGRLCEGNPRHMHHAARYTSLGSDLEYGRNEPLYEIGARNQALEMSGAQLHLNLHGYPAHEWTRPFTGYLPRGFELWTIPKGFFLIMRHHPSWAETARTLIEAVTKGLSAVPGLAEFNRRQIEICSIHSGGTPYEIINDVPCLLTAGRAPSDAADADHGVPGRDDLRRRLPLRPYRPDGDRHRRRGGLRIDHGAGGIARAGQG